MALAEKQIELAGNLQRACNFIASFLFLVLFLVSFYLQPTNKSTINPWIRRVTICYVATYMLRYLTFCILWTIGLDNISPEITERFLNPVIFDSCLVIGNFLFFLLMILRLHLSFPNSKATLLTLYTLLVSILIVNIFYFVYRRHRDHEGHIFYHDANKQKHPVYAYLFVLLVALNCMVGAIVIYKFNQKIWKLVQLKESVKDRSQSMSNLNRLMSTKKLSKRSTYHMIKKQAEHIEPCNARFLAASIRYTLLCTVCIVCTNLQFSGWILLQFDGISNEQAVLWFDLVWNWMFNVVLFINFFGIWLSFPFATRVYSHPFVCGRCHRRCERYCRFIVGGRIFVNEQRERNKVADEDGDDDEVQLEETTTI